MYLFLKSGSLVLTLDSLTYGDADVPMIVLTWVWRLLLEYRTYPSDPPTRGRNKAFITQGQKNDLNLFIFIFH